jgi:hypothetical protein
VAHHAVAWVVATPRPDPGSERERERDDAEEHGG